MMLKYRLNRLLPFPGCNFDGGGGGSTTSTQQLYSPEEAAERAKVMREAERIYGQTAGTIGASGFPGAVPITPSAQTQQGSQMLQNWATGAGAQQSGQLQNALQFGLRDVLNVQNNPALAGAIQGAVRPITQSYVDPGGVMSQIRTGAGQAGQFGSSRQGIAEGIAAGRYANAIGDVSSRMMSDAYGQGLQTFASTLAQAPELMQAQQQPALAMGAAGALEDELAREQAQYEADARMWDLNAEWAPLQNYANIVFGGSNPATQTQSDVQQSPLQTLGQVGSAGLTMYALYAL